LAKIGFNYGQMVTKRLQFLRERGLPFNLDSGMLLVFQLCYNISNNLRREVISMAKTAMIRARTNEDVKTGAEDILKRLGLTMSDAVNLFLNQVRLHKGLPFEVRIPNKTTLRTFKKTDKGKELNEYKSVDEFIKKMAV